MKFYYFGAFLGDVIFSFNNRKKSFHFTTILYGKLYTLFILGIWIIWLYTLFILGIWIICLLHMNCTIRLFYFVCLLSFSLHLRTKAVCFLNVALYILYAATM